MGKRCAVAGCSNSARTGHSLHVFPNDNEQRNYWIHFVKFTRADFSGPTQNSAICDAHFSEDCYEVERLKLKKLFRLATKKRLLPNSVPKLYPTKSADLPNDVILVEPNKKLKTSPALQESEKATIKCDAGANQQHLAVGEKMISTGMNVVYLHKVDVELKGEVTLTNKKLYFDSRKQVNLQVTIQFCSIQKLNMIHSVSSREKRIYAVYNLIIWVDDEITRYSFGTEEENADKMFEMFEMISLFTFGKNDKAKCNVNKDTYETSKRKTVYGTDDDADARSSNLLPPPKRIKTCSIVTFVGQRIRHQWILDDQSKKWYFGTVTKVLKKSDREAETVYEVRYDEEEDNAYELTHQDLLEDYTDSSLEMIDV